MKRLAFAALLTACGTTTGGSITQNTDTPLTAADIPVHVSAPTTEADDVDAAIITVALGSDELSTIALSGTGATLTREADPIPGNSRFVARSRVAEDKAIVLVLTDGTTLVTTAIVSFVSAPADPVQSSFTYSKTAIVADGQDSASVDVFLRSKKGGVPYGAHASLVGLAGEVLAAETVVDTEGHATLTLTRMSSGTVPVAVVSDGVTIGEQLVDFADPLSATPPTVMIDKATATADGADGVFVTLVATKPSGEVATRTAVSAAMSGSGNTVTTLAHAPGTTRRFLVQSTKAEAKTLTLTVNGIALSPIPLTFVPGSSSAQTSTLALAAATTKRGVAVSGTAACRDAAGNPREYIVLSGLCSGVPCSVDPFVFSPQSVLATNAAGEVAFSVTPLRAGTFSVQASCPGGFAMAAALVATPAFSVSQSTIVPSKASAIADDADTITVTVTLRDDAAQAVAGESVTLSATGTGNTIAGSPGTSAADGTVVFTLRSTKAQAKTLSASGGGLTITAAPSVTFTAGDPWSFLVTTNREQAVANGTDALTVQLTIVDAYDNPVPNVSIDYSATGTNNTFTPVSPQSTNSSGGVSFALRSTTMEPKTLSATWTGSPGAWSLPVAFVNVWQLRAKPAGVTSLERVHQPLAYDAENNYLYVATKQGFFRSADKGVNWVSASAGLPVGEVSFGLRNLIVDGQTLYIVAQTTNHPLAGFYRSNDFGASWTQQQTGIVAGGKVFSLARGAGGELYVSTGGASLAQAGIFRSYDGGDNWSATGTGTFVMLLASHPDVSNILYAENVNSGENVQGTLRRSFDYGATWSPVIGGVPLVPAGTYYPSVRALYFDPFVPGQMMANIVSGYSGLDRPWYSSDYGANWQTVATADGPNVRTSGYHRYVQSRIYSNKLGLNESNAGVTATTGDWTNIRANQGVGSDGEGMAMAFNPNDPNEIWVLNYNDIYYTFTGGH
ncbi:MAG: Ig-like domain-containing protein [Deltaproteobacteria bacterium]|nr:Ig-like domain-containing protein [Deltaproteobacteria bacterium]